jgi:hypothetical protein
VSGDFTRADAWNVSRAIVLFVVLGMHAGLLALWFTPFQRRSVAASALATRPMLLLYLPKPKVSKLRAENIRPERLSTDIAIAAAPPLLDPSSQSGPAAAPDGHGAAVNWAAEAHRAVRAFEIRRDQPPSGALSVSFPLEEWWRREHHAGDRFKNDAGDWIVWINADCYQVAGWRSNASPIGVPPPPTICRAAGATPHGD